MDPNTYPTAKVLIDAKFDREAMHRRAQRAEGRLEAALECVTSWQKLLWREDDPSPATLRMVLEEVVKELRKGGE